MRLPHYYVKKYKYCPRTTAISYLLGALIPVGLGLALVSFLAQFLNGLVVGLIIIFAGAGLRLWLCGPWLGKRATREFERRITCKLNTAIAFVNDNPDMQLSVAMVNRLYRNHISQQPGVKEQLHSMMQTVQSENDDTPASGTGKNAS